ncbi:GMC oxidoreductase [Ceratobasidium sp. AG-Ba]|nr:GMC oxidoreductase [Ceratobasidium sp. AG-Ba]
MGAAASKHVTNPARVATPFTSASESKHKSTVSADELASYKSYDYVIIGGGTAGCVLAHRLSEDPNVSVLVVEAGKDSLDQLFSRIPLTFAKLFKTEADWAYNTTPQPELNNRALFWPRGKMLGGCSSINAMMYTHAAPSDYDEWNTDGWRYEDLKQYFRKAERFTPHIAHPLVDKTHRGDEGHWRTGYSYISDMGKLWIESCKGVGIPYNPDINTPAGTIGVSEIVSHIDSNGERSSTSVSYLPKPVLARPNLQVLINTRTTRILFSGDRAVGAELAQTAEGERFRVAAKKEVILSAGAIGTPQILMASGVGPKEELEKAGVDVVKELPHVGRNMYDHLLGCVIFRATESLDYLGTPTGSLLPLLKWMTTGKGPLTCNIAEAAAFFRSDDPTIFPNKSKDEVDTTSGPGAPDIEMIGASLAFAEHGFRPITPGEKAFTIAAVLLRPQSTGTVTIKSGDVWEDAIIEPNYFKSPHDVKIMIQGVRTALRVAHTKPLASKLVFKPENKDTSSMYFMGDADPETVTDEVIEGWLRREVETIYHPVGTARMGTSAENSVVDARLRVHGIQGLRIVDASIFPTQLSGHPCAGVVATAEKAADLIKVDHA